MARLLLVVATVALVLSFAFGLSRTCAGDLVLLSSADEPSLWWTFPRLTPPRVLEDREPGLFGSSGRFGWQGVFLPELRGAPFGPFWLRRNTPFFGGGGAAPPMDLVDPSMCVDSPLSIIGLAGGDLTTLAQDPDTGVYVIRQGYERHVAFRRWMAERRLRPGWAFLSFAALGLALLALGLTSWKRARLVFRLGGLAETRDRSPELTYRAAAEDLEVRMALDGFARRERAAASLLSWMLGTAPVVILLAFGGFLMARERATPDRPPSPPPALSPSRPRSVVEIAAGGNHTCARLDTGVVRCWGDGATSEHGETTARTRDIPLGGGRATSIIAGSDHSCALLDDDYLECWSPLWPFPSISRYAMSGGPIAAGGETTCADYHLLNARCWTGPPTKPHVIPLGDGWGNGYAFERLSVGVQGVCGSWTGGSRCAAFGAGPAPAWLTVADLGPVESLALGESHVCAVLAGGRVRCWGEGEFGQLGRGDDEAVLSPSSPDAKDVDVGGPVAELAMGAHHTCALLTDGHVRCWGQGTYGQLGYGSRDNVGDVRVPAELGDVSIGGRVLQIVAGSEHTCARLDGGRVRCWGRGDRGQLGYAGRANVGDQRLPSDAGDMPVL